MRDHDGENSRATRRGLPVDVLMADLSDPNLNDRQWLSALEEIAETRGSFLPVGLFHSAVYREAGSTLLVTFESIPSIRQGDSEGAPLGWRLSEENGWSHLCLLSHEGGWYRDISVYGHFDRMVDDAVFEDFDNVIFYGVGAAGYAAAAYSVAAPGCTVIAVQPQATLSPSEAIWDRRFPAARRLDFTSRYGYAPDMIEGAAKVAVIHDPMVDEDAMHAALFRGPQVIQLRAPNFGFDLAPALDALGVLSEMIDAAIDGDLTPEVFFTEMRARRDHVPYLRNLLARAENEKRPARVIAICNHALRFHKGPKFRRSLERAEAMLDAARR